jgi:hypothetical protein
VTKKLAAIRPSGMTMTASLGKGRYGILEPQLVIAWSEPIAAHAAMAHVFTACSMISNLAGDERFAVEPPSGVAAMGGTKSQATIRIDLENADKPESERAMKILRTVANG